MLTGPIFSGRDVAVRNYLPLPQEHGSLRPIFGPVCLEVVIGASCALRANQNA